MAIDVSEADFQQQVLDRSHQVPVVVDFWAEWCGPCRILGPVLERSAAKREGKMVLAKLDTDHNQELARRYGIQGIPAVKAFRDGEVVSEFVGAVPEPQVEQFMDGLVPSEAEQLVGAGDEQSLRRALELEPGRADAALALARLLLEQGDRDGARATLEPVQGDFAAEGLAARLALEASPDGAPAADLDAAFEALDGDDPGTALERLTAAVGASEGETQDLIRKVMVGIFAELGNEHPLAREYRRRLASALY